MPLNLETIKRDILQAKLLHVRERKLYLFLLALLFFVVLEILLCLVIFGGAVVHGVSMYPEMQSGDFAVYHRLDHTFARGDIVVIYDGVTGRSYVKRVIGQEGDLVAFTDDGHVVVNGIPLSEPYAQHTPTLAQDLAFPQTVPAGHIFVLGDNRVVSKDSRSREIGMIARENIRGTLLFFIRVHSEAG